MKMRNKKAASPKSPKMQHSEHLKTGKLGEEIAKKFLMKRGFRRFELNFRRKCGEIDIVAHETSGDMLWFFEVKTLSGKGFQPEEKVDRRKIRKICKTIEMYLMSKSVSQETPWRLGVISVLLDREARSAQVSLIPVF